MPLLNAPPGAPLSLAGTAYERGRAQATLCPDQADFVRAAVATRLTATRAALALPEVQSLIRGQRDYTERHYATRPPALAFTHGNPCTPDWRAFSFQSRRLA
jgi:hypothetical protein